MMDTGSVVPWMTVLRNGFDCNEAWVSSIDDDYDRKVAVGFPVARGLLAMEFQLKTTE